MKKVCLLVSLLLVCCYPLAMAQDDNETCMSCHADNDLEGTNHGGDLLSMFVAEDSLAISVHADMDCIDCHGDLSGFDDYPHEEQLERVDCATCHDDVQEVYDQSAHAKAVDNPNAPTCASCHGNHTILHSDNPEAMTSPNKLPYTCSNCHSKSNITTDPDIIISNAFGHYMEGIHAGGIAKGFDVAANCNDCHGIHDLRRSDDRLSKVHKQNIPKTCANCHNDIYIKYSRGIHGKALAAGVMDSPNCTDCHGEHDILRPDDPNSPVNASNLADFVCGRCHNDPKLLAKYDMHEERFTSYQDSYHGLAINGGSLKAATCISCHESHDILPMKNPASSIHPDNLLTTCQSCHPKATEAFATSYSHNITEEAGSDINLWVAYAYILLIILVIGGMLAHNGMIWVRHAIIRYRKIKSQKTVSRFNGNMVFQHIVLVVSFFVLVMTGFGLKYPNSWIAKFFALVAIDETVRSVIHRIAAVFMMYISIHHAFFIAFTKRGREEAKAIWFAMSDLPLTIQNIKYHLGMTKEQPKFERYDYTEKAEYWALAWGTVVMVVTGLILWFPTWFTSFLPSWTIKIAETVHFYEAWLATLAIIVWHLFFVIFHPDRYPMSFTWLDGKMPLDEAKHHHRAWYDKDFADKDGNEKKPDDKQN